MKTSLPPLTFRTLTDEEYRAEMYKPDPLIHEAVDSMKTGTIHHEGAKASKDSSRDNWRTPKWLMDVLHAEFGDMWDATGRGEQDWAHGCFDGNDESDAILAAWPKASPVFCNPPFSGMEVWSERIAEHAGPVVTVCKLTPSTKWWRVLTVAKTKGVFEQLDTIKTPCGTIATVGLCRGVTLWLLPKRVAYEPPPGIKATSPSFDSCVVVRR